MPVSYTHLIDMIPKLSMDYYETINVINEFKRSRED